MKSTAHSNFHRFSRTYRSPFIRLLAISRKNPAVTCPRPAQPFPPKSPMTPPPKPEQWRDNRITSVPRVNIPGKFPIWIPLSVCTDAFNSRPSHLWMGRFDLQKFGPMLVFPLIVCVLILSRLLYYGRLGSISKCDRCWVYRCP